MAAAKETVDKVAAADGNDVEVKRLHTEYEANVDRLGDSLDVERRQQQERLGRDCESSSSRIPRSRAQRKAGTTKERKTVTGKMT